MSEDFERTMEIEKSRKMCRQMTVQDIFLGMVIMKEDLSAKTQVIACDTEQVCVHAVTTDGEKRASFTYKELYDEWLVELPSGTGFMVAGVPMVDEDGNVI